MSIDYSLIWNKVMAAIREETDPTSFDIWFSMVKYHSRKNDNIYVIVPNTLTKDWISPDIWIVLKEIQRFNQSGY